MKKAIKIAVWVQFFLVFALMFNHFMRGLHWQPLMILFIVSMAFVVVEG